jgi:hypothetical protein
MAHAQIGGNLEADGAHFNGDHLTPDSTTDTHSFRLYGTTVKGVVYLRDATVASAFVFSLAQMQSLDLSGTIFEGPVNLGASKVALDGRFEGTTFKDVTDLSDLSIGVVATFFKTTWPGNYPNGTPIPVNIGNMSYRTLYVTSSDTLRESTEWSDVRRLLERATYWSQNYTDLEAWYRRIGRIADADHVFVELRRHERPAEPVPNFVG